MIRLLLDILEERVHRFAHSDNGHISASASLARGNRSGSSKFLEHGRRRTSSPITVSEEEERLAGDFQVLVARVSSSDLVDVALSVVFIYGRHVRQELTPIQADPVEGGVGELVHFGPR